MVPVKCLLPQPAGTRQTHRGKATAKANPRRPTVHRTVQNMDTAAAPVRSNRHRIHPKAGNIHLLRGRHHSFGDSGRIFHDNDHCKFDSHHWTGHSVRKKSRNVHPKCPKHLMNLDSHPTKDARHRCMGALRGDPSSRNGAGR